MKKNVYMVQANYLHGKSTYFPYAAGVLVASAKADDFICENYSFGEIFFLREDTDSVLARMEKPAVVGFSNYLWNYEYNRLLATKLKEKYPDCVVIFGGHHISGNNDLAGECPFADYFIFGEGEEVFVKLLRSLAGEGNICDIPDIAYKKDDALVFTHKQCMTGTDYASPYLTGVFDSILEKHQDLSFYAVIETSRGCPYKCRYCDWGNLDSPKVKFFPLEKIYAELEWLADHGIDGFGGADANFGIVKRDEEIIDRMVEIHNRTGHLRNFQTSYAKNSNDIVFSMTKKLNECGMNKGVTLSFQSLSREALDNVGRENIPLENYKKLLGRYAAEGIATYTELILGLPGETYDSFVSGIETLLCAGQHHAIYIHNCEYLPCAGMSDREYTEKYKIGVTKIPLNQPHREADEKDEVGEYSRIVTSTYSMSEEEWVRSNMFSFAVQSLHHGGLLPFFAIYLNREKGIDYTKFYSDFLDYINKNNDTLAFEVFSETENRLRKVISDNASLTFTDSRFGNVIWPGEEYIFLNLVYDVDRFYEETEPFLEKYIDSDMLCELLSFQKFILKKPFDSTAEETFSYNFREYFSAVYRNEDAILREENEICRVNVQRPFDSFSDYARYSVWYGRKEFGNLHLSATESVKTSQ